MSNIDFSKVVTVEDVEASRAVEDRAEARRYLNRTDWMVIRQVETGTPVPKDVQKSRAEARKAAK